MSQGSEIVCLNINSCSCLPDSPKNLENHKMTTFQDSETGLFSLASPDLWHLAHPYLRLIHEYWPYSRSSSGIPKRNKTTLMTQKLSRKNKKTISEAEMWFEKRDSCIHFKRFTHFPTGFEENICEFVWAPPEHVLHRKVTKFKVTRTNVPLGWMWPR